jgi:hypothetical protein
MNGMDNSWAQAMAQQAAIEAFYGPLPAANVDLHVELTQTQHRPGYTLFCWQVQAGKPVGPRWTLRLAWPRGAQSAPVLLSPDACWPHVVGAAALRHTPSTLAPDRLLPPLRPCVVVADVSSRRCNVQQSVIASLQRATMRCNVVPRCALRIVAPRA